MKEILSLRKQQSERSKAIMKLEERLADERLAVEKGGPPRELRLLQQDLDDERMRLETLERRIGTIEQQEEHDHRLARLMELDSLIEAARAQLTETRVEACDTFDTLVVRVATAEAALNAVEAEFIGIARTLAPIDAYDAASRAASDALREQLLARGAKLKAIGMTRGRAHAFTIAAGGDAPWPEPWGWLVLQGVEGLQRRRMREAELAARAGQSATAGASA
jgi:hypothetical protein